MVDEFENEFPNTASNISDRVRASVAELCGAIDDLVEGDANEDEAPEGAEAPSLREQLLDSWQGKSYYERLQMAVCIELDRGALARPDPLGVGCNREAERLRIFVETWWMSRS